MSGCYSCEEVKGEGGRGGGLGDKIRQAEGT